MSTSSTNDVIYAWSYTTNTGLAVTISDGSTHLTWHQRAKITSSHGDITVWWAASASKLSNYVITFTASGAPGNIMGAAFAVSGANTANPFDPNLNAAPASAVSSSAGTTPTVSITTTDPYTMIVGLVGVDQRTSPTRKRLHANDSARAPRLAEP
jgi:hypothetical protein